MLDEARTRIRVNSVFVDVCHRFRYEDLDSFGLRFASSITDYLMQGFSLRQAVEKASTLVETQFFRVNRIGRTRFAEDLLPALNGLVKESTLNDFILGFKKYAERQLARHFRAHQDEEVLRSNLQSYLAGNFLTYREVQSGTGQSDILVVSPFQELIETKIWKGEQYFEDGLMELPRYLQTEGLLRGFYVVGEFGAAASFLSTRDEAWTEFRDGREITVVFVRIPPTSPSKAGRSTRLSAKKSP
jgi:hypothetical protein